VDIVGVKAGLFELSSSDFVILDRSIGIVSLLFLGSGRPSVKIDLSLQGVLGEAEAVSA